MITRNCLNCQDLFSTRQIDVDRGHGKFCSRKCCGEFNGPLKIVVHENNVKCAWCALDFYMRPSSQKNSKSGLFFCTREHKDAAQRIDGLKELHLPHYGSGDGSSSYRAKAFRELPNVCARCGWCEYLEVLEVHHIDKNRANNNIDNLEILCPTCHQLFHFLDKSGVDGVAPNRHQFEDALQIECSSK